MWNFIRYLRRAKTREETLRRAAHDLRSPISVIRGYSDLRREGGGADATEAEYLDAVGASLEKLTRIAETLSGTTPAAPKTTIAVSPRPIPAGHKGVFLIVDDDVGMRAQWRLGLKKLGCGVVEAASGEELLAMPLDFAGLKAAVVDYQYEGSALNGLDVVEYLRRKKLPRIHLCTANHDDARLRREAERLGVASVIPKPLPAEAIAVVAGGGC